MPISDLEVSIRLGEICVIPLVEVQEVLGRPKRIVHDMTWRGKNNKVPIDWMEARMLVQYADEVEIPEQLSVVCQWKKQSLRKAEVWTFVLLYRSERIYALDIQPDSAHKNNVGIGRDFYKQLIHGAHEHTYSADGEGYAEPISLHTGDPASYWAHFLKQTGINPFQFNHPGGGQQELLL
jgi:hypothetical protein